MPLTPQPATAPPGEAVPNDGYGALLRDCYQAGPRRGTHVQIIERDDGYVGVEDAYRYFSRPDEWIAGERSAVASATGRVLDIGCAAGRHMLALIGDHEVVGIDPSPGAVAVAREQGLDVRVGSIAEPGDDLGTFDTLLMLGGNLGLLGSKGQAPIVLERLGALANAGAQVLAIGHDPHEAATPEHRAYHDRNRECGRLPGQVRMRVRYKTWLSSWFNRLLLSPAELESILGGTAWALDEVTYSPRTAGFYLARLTHRPATC